MGRMERLDVLPRFRPALDKVRGAVDRADLDPELQRIVELASAAFAMPMAALTLVLAWSQRFRAHVGFPTTLADEGGTPRDVSFCQLVVRDEAVLEVNDATLDERVPQELVRTSGIRSYLGAPVHLGGHVIGALCLIDVVVRTFDEQDRALLTRLAADASRRLEALALLDGATSVAEDREPVVSAVREQRTQLQTLLGTLSQFRVMLADLRAAGGPAEPTLIELESALADGEAAALALRRSVTAVEQAYVEVPHVTVADIISASTVLARQRRPTLAEPRWTRSSVGTFVAVPRPQAIRLLATVLTAVGSAPGGVRLEGQVRVDDHDVVVHVAAPGATRAWLMDQVIALAPHASPRDGLVLRSEPQGLAVVMRAALPE